MLALFQHRCKRSIIAGAQPQVVSYLCLAHHLGKRNRHATEQFIGKLRNATSPANRYQLSSDGFRFYPDAIHAALWDRVSYGQLIKVYASPRDGEQRYSPGDVVDARPVPVFGNPDPRRICTSYVERQNLSLRMGMRRMTRLTNAFSKSWKHLEAAYSLWFAYYNFVRIHKTLCVTPAMEAGLTDRQWELSDLLCY